MGCVDTITFDKMPKQGSYLGKRAKVCFHYDTSKTVEGIVVRDDADAPYEMIFKLDDERYVRAVECQYHIF
jgi:hypothetical protein